MTGHEHTSDHEEVDAAFAEITGQLATHMALQDGTLVEKVVDAGANQVELPDTPFAAPATVERNGKTYVVRNLDQEGMTPPEQALVGVTERRDGVVSARVNNILAGEPLGNLPKEINSEPGVKAGEKDEIRSSVDAFVGAAEAARVRPSGISRDDE